MTPTEQDKELRALLGEMPGFVIDWFELGDDLRNEWKKGGKASDFGGHHAFIQKYEKKLTKFVIAYRKRVALEARIDEAKLIAQLFVGLPTKTMKRADLKEYLINRIAELKAQQEEL